MTLSRLGRGATTRLVLEFRLLGPLEIREGARILPPLAPKQRALLAAMLLRAGQFVSKQRLIDDVWGEDAPATVTNSLENQIWRLRQALGKDVVVTRSPGYVLAVEPGQVDALRLERLLGRARAGRGGAGRGGLRRGERGRARRRGRRPPAPPARPSRCLAAGGRRPAPTPGRRCARCSTATPRSFGLR